MVNDHEKQARRHVLTEAESALMRDRYFEAKATRLAESDLALVKALRLGEALRALKGS
jgi:hypothetical protein